MKVVFDIECERLHNPQKIWVIVCKCVESGAVSIFRNLTDDQAQADEFEAYAKTVTQWIGHNILGYDIPVVTRLLGINIPVVACVDTLIISKLVNYSRPGGHSLEQYGLEFGLEKMDIGKSIAGHNPFFNQWSQKMEDYCERDTDINLRVYRLYLGVLNDPSWASSIALEHRFQLIVNDLHDNGFGFNTDVANRLLLTVQGELKGLDDKILEAFPPREVLIREFTPRATKFGTINKSSVPRVLHKDIHLYEVGTTYKHTKLDPFNPSSHKQLIEVLNEAGWKPEDKTTTHIDTERALGQLARSNRNNRRDVGNSSGSGDIAVANSNERPIDLNKRLAELQVTGWKINEHNLSTLPATAPEPARLLAKRILLESRRRTLTEWLALVQEDGRIHGDFYGIGAWTHRMSHQKPNTANIPNSVKIADGSERLLGKELRSLWIAPKNRLLVGVDAEAIQFRLFAHMIDDPVLTNAIVNGKKSDKTDPHSLNQVVFGSMCKTRNASKHSMFALFFGGRANKISQIMGCSKAEAEQAIKNLLKQYPGLAQLEEKTFPNDAKRGYFVGIDGRKVPIPGDSISQRKHLCMSGYLQNGEKIIMARAAIIADDLLQEEKALKKWMFVAIVHDALDSEVRNSMTLAKKVAQIKADAIAEAGKFYNLRCPMAGSYFNEDTKDYTIGTNWYATH